MDTMWLDLWRFHGMALLSGCVLDWILGDPHDFPHPVRLMGGMISWMENRIRAWSPMKGREKLAGCILVCAMCVIWWAFPWWILTLARHLASPGFVVIPFLLETVICYEMMAAKSLCAESMKVCRSLESGDVEKARYQVSMIVGRDTAVLDREGIARAAVETVAENASDGVAAPFLFMALFGPGGGTFYKAVNTMDSMLGYKNEAYILFGRAAARLDDLLNFIPARISGCMMCLGAGILPGMSGKEAWRIFLRDRKKHASPNSAHGEAACAGALGLRLAGDAWYGGKLHKKPFIGDEGRLIEPGDIRRANALMFVMEGLMMFVLAAALAAASVL